MSKSEHLFVLTEAGTLASLSPQLVPSLIRGSHSSEVLPMRLVPLSKLPGAPTRSQRWCMNFKKS